MRVLSYKKKGVDKQIKKCGPRKNIDKIHFVIGIEDVDFFLGRKWRLNYGTTSVWHYDLIRLNSNCMQQSYDEC